MKSRYCWMIHGILFWLFPADSPDHRNAQIFRGDPRCCLLPCEMRSSAMELKLGVIGFCWPHRQKHMQNECVHNLWYRVAFYMYVSIHSNCSRWSDIHTWWTMVILIMSKTQRPTICGPCQDKDGTALWYPLYICVEYHTTDDLQLKLVSCLNYRLRLVIQDWASFSSWLISLIGGILAYLWSK